MPALPPDELRQLAAEVAAERDEDVEVLLVPAEVSEADAYTKRDELAQLASRRRALTLFSKWSDVTSLSAVGASGIMVSVLARPGTTAHEWAIAVGAPALMASGAAFIKRLRKLSMQ